MRPNLEEIAEQVRQHSRLVIADDYELALQHTRSRRTSFHQGNLDSESDESGLWLSLRVLHRRQPGRAITSFCTPDALRELVESAFESSLRSTVDPWFRFPLWRESVGAVSWDESATPEYTSLYAGLDKPPALFDETYESWEIETRLFRKTEKFQPKNLRQVHAMKLSLLDQTESGILRVKEERAQSKPLDGRDAWLETALNQCAALKKAASAGELGPTGFMLAPAVASQLLKRVAGWFHADEIQQHRSPLAGTSQRAFSHALTLVDDGNRPNGAQSAPFDMEGSLSQQTVLVERGEPKEWLYDTYSAGRDNRLSTGNFLRSPHASKASIAASNFYFAPSSQTPDRLLQELGTGTLIATVESLEPTGDGEGYRLRGNGWRAVQGECVEPLRDISVEFDLKDLFQRVVAVGDDLEFYGSFGSPSLLLDKLGRHS